MSSWRKSGYFNETNRCSPVHCAPRASVHGSQWGRWQRKQGQFCGVGACFCGVWLLQSTWAHQQSSAVCHTPYKMTSLKASLILSRMRLIKKYPSPLSLLYKWMSRQMWTGQACQLSQDIHRLCCCGGPKGQWEVLDMVIDHITTVRDRRMAFLFK